MSHCLRLRDLISLRLTHQYRRLRRDFKHAKFTQTSRSRSSSVTRLFASLFLYTYLVVTCTHVAAASWYENRATYKDAVAATRTNNTAQFERLVAELGDYPLVPYLYYLRALTRLSQTNSVAAVAFRDANSQYTFGDRFMSQWLRIQAGRGQWQDYVTYYQPTSDVIAQCRYALGLIRTGDKATAYSILPELWNVAKSQDKSCDPAFEIWIRDGGISNELAWDRLKKALDARQYQLGRYITRFVSNDVKPSADLLYQSRRDPRIVANLNRFPNSTWVMTL